MGGEFFPYRELGVQGCQKGCRRFNLWFRFFLRVCVGFFFSGRRYGRCCDRESVYDLPLFLFFLLLVFCRSSLTPCQFSLPRSISVSLSLCTSLSFVYFTFFCIHSSSVRFRDTPIFLAFFVELSVHFKKFSGHYSVLIIEVAASYVVSRKMIQDLFILFFVHVLAQAQQAQTLFFQGFPTPLGLTGKPSNVLYVYSNINHDGNSYTSPLHSDFTLTS